MLVGCLITIDSSFFSPALWSLSLYTGTFTWEMTRAVNAVCIIVTSLYIWELIYRVEIGWPLLVHHLCTLLLTQLALPSLQVCGLGLVCLLDEL